MFMNWHRKRILKLKKMTYKIWYLFFFFSLLDHLVFQVMIYLRFHLPVFFYTNFNSHWIRIYSICLIFFSQMLFSSSSSLSTKSLDRVYSITKSIDDYMCQNYVFTCFFRNRYHQQQSDDCKSLLILHSCFHHDVDTIRMCHDSALNRLRKLLDEQTPKQCFTSSVYKTFYAQHLRSIAPSRTIVKCQIFVLFLLLISFIIKIRACCWHCISVNVKACAIALLKIFRWEKKDTKKSNFLRWQTHECLPFIYSFIRSIEWQWSNEYCLLCQRGQATSRKLIANAFRACSSSFFIIRWSSYNNNARGLNEIVLNNHFLLSSSNASKYIFRVHLCRTNSLVTYRVRQFFSAFLWLQFEMNVLIND